MGRDLLTGSSTVYSFDDQDDDNDLSGFSINTAPSYLYTVLNDIKAVNPYIKVHLVPWSPVRIDILFDREDL